MLNLSNKANIVPKSEGIDTLFEPEFIANIHLIDVDNKKSIRKRTLKRKEMGTRNEFRMYVLKVVKRLANRQRPKSFAEEWDMRICVQIEYQGKDAAQRALQLEKILTYSNIQLHL